MARHPELALFDGTPAAMTIDLAGRMFPSLEPVPLVVDTAPLIEPLGMADAAMVGSAGTGVTLIAASLGMMAVAASILVIALRRSTS
jgi:hypothetical protein